MIHSNSDIVVVFGTRPEAIKFAPIIWAAQQSNRAIHIISTGQQGSLLDEILLQLGIAPNEDLRIHTPGQTPTDILARTLQPLKASIQRVNPICVLVQGDTTSALAGALASFDARVPVGHVEAGYRTSDPARPFPEEMNRRLISRIARRHYAPTEHCRTNLVREGIDPYQIVITGNTIVDALNHFLMRPEPPRNPVCVRAANIPVGERLLLATMHRRENWGDGAQKLATALAAILDAEPALSVALSVHPNPLVKAPLAAWASSQDQRVLIAEGIAYPDFCWLLNRADVILTDSGGIQEEATALGKVALVTRSETERTEALESGHVRLVGTEPNSVTSAVLEQLALASGPEPSASTAIYGDGHAGEAIVRDVLTLT